MRINGNGQMYDDDGNYRGSIDGDGWIYDDSGNHTGRIDGDGWIYDGSGNHTGRMDGDGWLYDSRGDSIGQIRNDGYLESRRKPAAPKQPQSYQDDSDSGFETPAPPALGEVNADWGGSFAVKLILLVLLAVGFITVAVYCWIQLLICAVITVILERFLCKRAFLGGKEPAGLFPIALGIIYTPTLIITLCQDWHGSVLDEVICIAGGIAVGLVLALLVSKATKGICRMVYGKSKK